VAAVPRASLAEEIEQDAADVGVADADRRVQGPAERRAARASPRLVLGDVWTVGGVVRLLGLPRDDPVLDVDLPRARARAVDAVRRAHDLVVLPPLPVEALPLPAVALQRVPPVGRPPRPEIARAVEKAHAVTSWGTCEA